jgi:uncharacterized lipoprotein YajG
LLKTILALVAASLLSACGTTSVGLKYAAQATTEPWVQPAPAIKVAAFDDKRGEPETWLGAIRGGFGNPLKTLESDQSVSRLVQAAFADGVRARGATLADDSARVRISGVVRRLDCIQIVRREANAEIDVTVTDAASGAKRFSRSYAATNLEGSLISLNTGVFASVDDLRVVLEKTLQNVVDKALDDPELRASLKP